MHLFNPLNYTDAPQQIRKTRVVDARIEDVWDVVADHQGMTQWMPMISHVDLKTPDAEGGWGEGCERNCKFGPDLLEETVVHWDPPSGYAYSIADMHLVRDHVAHISLERVGEGKTQVTWTQYFRPNGFAAKAWFAKTVMMPWVMNKALGNLEARVGAASAKTQPPQMVATVAVLLATLLTMSCAADLRTRSIKDGAQTEAQITTARQRLESAIAAQGFNTTDRFRTYEVTATDHWRGMLGNMGRVWNWKEDEMKLRYTLGDFDGQVEVTAGPKKGFKAGVQSFDYYEYTDGRYDTDVKDDKRLIFAINAFHYFFELGPRMLNAPVIRDYPDDELAGEPMHRVFVSWGTDKTRDYDQYVVWIGKQSGLIEAVTHTVRDNYLPGAQPMYTTTEFDDFRDVDGVKIPFKQTVTLFGPDAKEKGYVHRLTVTDFQWDAFAPEAIRPNATLEVMGDEKPTT